MTIDKEIRGVMLKKFLPHGVTLDEHLDNIERYSSVANIRYDYTNAYDKTCMVISIMGVDVAYVNVDDKRFVKPLLDASKDGVVEAAFLEVYRPEDGGTPIVRWTVTVDLDDVEKIVPGEQWQHWDYKGLRLLKIGDMANVKYCATMIKKALLQGADGINDTTLRLIETFAAASLIDMSVETTELYDDLIFLLETRRRAIWRSYLNILQHASTVRRTDKRRKVFTEKWWPEFIKDEPADRLCKSFAVEIAKQGKVLSEDVLRESLQQLEENLMHLPYDLYEHLDDMESLWSVIYYTKIPEEKFHKLLSALTLRARLMMAVKGNCPLVVQNVTVNKHYEQNFEKDSKALLLNL